jgi:hypothetical protein
MSGQPPDQPSTRPVRLSKLDVETLLARYDDNPVAAVETALRRLCNRPLAGYDELIGVLVGMGRLTTDRERALLAREVAALDGLAAELNETRSLPT